MTARQRPREQRLRTTPRASSPLVRRGFANGLLVVPRFVQTEAQLRGVRRSHGLALEPVDIEAYRRHRREWTALYSPVTPTAGRAS